MNSSSTSKTELLPLTVAGNSHRRGSQPLPRPRGRALHLTPPSLIPDVVLVRPWNYIWLEAGPVAMSSDDAPRCAHLPALGGRAEIHTCAGSAPRPASYLGCCGLADDHPAWALLVLMGNGSVGCPLIQEALGRVDATVLDASFLFELLTYPVTVMEVAPAGLICGWWTENREDRLVAAPWLQLPATAVEWDRQGPQHREPFVKSHNGTRFSLKRGSRSRHV